MNVVRLFFVILLFILADPTNDLSVKSRWSCNLLAKGELAAIITHKYTSRRTKLVENDRNGRRENTLVKMVDKIQMEKERRTKEKSGRTTERVNGTKWIKKTMRKRVKKGGKKKREEKKNKWNRACVGTLSYPLQCSFNFDSIFRRSDGKRDAETKKISTWSRRCPWINENYVLVLYSVAINVIAERWR